MNFFSRLFGRSSPAPVAPKPGMSKGAKGAVAGSTALMALAIGVIGGWEGLELKSYRDIVGVWTICYGETNGVGPGQTSTKAECDTQLARQIGAYEARLDKCLTATVPGKAKVAFVSWAYNVGTGAACSSTLVRKANAGDLVGACNELPKWNRAGGKVVNGLTRRREAERTLCLEGVREGV